MSFSKNIKKIYFKPTKELEWLRQKNIKLRNEKLQKYDLQSEQLRALQEEMSKKLEQEHNEFCLVFYVINWTFYILCKIKILTTIQFINDKINYLPKGYIFTYSDFLTKEKQNKEAVIKSLVYNIFSFRYKSNNIYSQDYTINQKLTS